MADKPAGISRAPAPGLDTGAAPFSHIVTDGLYAYLSGVVATDIPGTHPIGDVARETEIVMTAIRDALAGAGIGMDRIVRVDIHMTDLGRMAEMNEVYRRFFPSGALPARTCTGATALAGGSSLEITVMARL